MEAYERSTAPLIDFYSNLGLLLPIPATGSPEEICEGTVRVLKQRLAVLPKGSEFAKVR
jgi:adenylate kinase family enzyme